MTSERLFRVDFEAGIKALKDDLIRDGGPQISSLRNHPFAILPYFPEDEFKLRRRLVKLTAELRAAGWEVLSLDLQAHVLRLIKDELDDELEFYIETEREQSEADVLGGLEALVDELGPILEGPEGIAGRVAAEIRSFADKYPAKAERLVVFLGHAGALFPFHRSSALLKHLAGRTGGVPVVLLYPGHRGPGKTELSFMGVQKADKDYRPRIYP